MESSKIFMPEGYQIDPGIVAEWHRVVSDANWRKGQVIARFVDESGFVGHRMEVFAKTVGGVVTDHASRLHCVYRRFSEVKDKYPKLLWSHFLAALDWDDAEAWLQTANDDDLSVKQMRLLRWERLS